MKPYEIVLAASTVLMASTSLSTAATIGDAANAQSYSHIVNWGLPLSAPTEVLTFDGFDPALGTLTEVVISVEATIGGYVDIYNASPSTAASVTAHLSNTARVQLPTALEPSVIFNSTSYTNASLAPLTDSGHQAVTGNTTKTYTITSSLSSYTTSWTVEAAAKGSQTSSSTPSTGSVTYQDTGGVIVNVTYDYTPPSTTSTPEPATLVVLGSGLAGLGLLRRRRKAN